MKKIPKDEYLKEKSNYALYNLPSEVEYCKKCLMSNQRPNMTSEHYNTIEQKKNIIKFTDGICDACKYFELKDDIDWEERERELKTLLDKYRSRNGSYDVVVPGSGGKDSFYVSHLLKTKYNMHPITCTFAPNIYTEWGKSNLQNWVDSGFTNYLYSPDNRVHKMITRLSVEYLLHPFQPWIIGQKNFPVKFASMMKIPLLFYGENPAEYGNPHDQYDDNMNMEWFACDNQDEIFLAGLPISKIKKDLSLENYELDTYIPITTKQYKDANIKYSPLSYFIPWHQQSNYYYTIENSKNFIISPERTVGTYTKYSSIDDKIDDLHYYTTFIKFGLGRVHYDVAQEIRCGDITKEEGMKLINNYNGEYPKRWMQELCEYLSINPNENPKITNLVKDPWFDEKSFNNLCDKFRSPHLWKLVDDKWVLKNRL